MYGHLHNQTWSAFRPSFKWRGQHFPGFLPHAGRRFTVTRRKRALACIHRHLSVKDAKKGFIALGDLQTQHYTLATGLFRRELLSQDLFKLAKMVICGP